jgi:hypothetical protein
VRIEPAPAPPARSDPPPVQLVDVPPVDGVPVEVLPPELAPSEPPPVREEIEPPDETRRGVEQAPPGRRPEVKPPPRQRTGRRPRQVRWPDRGHVPVPMPIEPRQRHRHLHEWDHAGGGWGCILVERPPCGVGPLDHIPVLRLVERVRRTGEREPEIVEYSVAPGLARIRHGAGEMIYDEPRQRIALYDNTERRWDSWDLGAWEAWVDSLADERLRALWPHRLRFQELGDRELVSDYECRPYELVVLAELDTGERERLVQRIWLSRDIEMTRDSYTTYRHALWLFDRMWQEIPVARPPGVVMRTRQERRAAEGWRDGWDEVEDAVVEEIGYRFVPPDFFDSPGPRVLSAAHEADDD